MDTKIENDKSVNAGKQAVKRLVGDCGRGELCR